jgi:hypothetical protein
MSRRLPRSASRNLSELFGEPRDVFHHAALFFGKQKVIMSPGVPAAIAVVGGLLANNFGAVAHCGPLPRYARTSSIACGARTRNRIYLEEVMLATRTPM